MKKFSALLKFSRMPLFLGCFLVFFSSEPLQGQRFSKMDSLNGNGEVQRKTLTYEFLQQGNRDTIVNFSNYEVPKNAQFPTNIFEGKLTLHNLNTSGQFREVKDVYGYTNSADVERMHLPLFDYEFVQSGSHIIPRERGYLENEHPHWEYILEPGRVWDENGDRGFSRAAIPFTLKQKNQNCLHNGVLMFLFKNGGDISHVTYQITGETCGYFKFDMWGTVEAGYKPYSVDSKDSIVEKYTAEVSGRMPVKSIAELAKDNPGANPVQFSAPKEVSAEGMTLYGFVIDGINYVGGCQTRSGTYPFCEVLNVPSYSTAKSIAAGMGLMRLEKLYPRSSKKTLGNLIPDCSKNGNWNDVTMENALNMATGNYDILTEFKDEGAPHTNQFFIPEDHKSKIAYSCSQYHRMANPGSTWVYHTSDTYILGTAMNAYLRQKTNDPKADYFTDLIVRDILKPLGASPTLQKTQRTYDSIAQPFSGFGLIFHPDDIAKIGQFLNNGARINGRKLFDEKMFSDILRPTENSGLKATETTRYINGFWLLDLEPLDVCYQNRFIPSMEGYGGIKIILLPNGTVYYYFSDNYEYAWREAVMEANRIRPFCQN